MGVDRIKTSSKVLIENQLHRQKLTASYAKKHRIQEKLQLALAAVFNDSSGNLIYNLPKNPYHDVIQHLRRYEVLRTEDTETDMILFQSDELQYNPTEPVSDPTHWTSFVGDARFWAMPSILKRLDRAGLERLLMILQTGHQVFPSPARSTQGAYNIHTRLILYSSSIFHGKWYPHLNNLDCEQHVLITGPKFEKAVNHFALLLMSQFMSDLQSGRVFLQGMYIPVSNFKQPSDVTYQCWTREMMTKTKQAFLSAVKTATVNRTSCYVDCFYEIVLPGRKGMSNAPYRQYLACHKVFLFHYRPKNDMGKNEKSGNSYRCFGNICRSYEQGLMVRLEEPEPDDSGYSEYSDEWASIWNDARASNVTAENMLDRQQTRERAILSSVDRGEFGHMTEQLFEFLATQVQTKYDPLLKSLGWCLSQGLPQEFRAISSLNHALVQVLGLFKASLSVNPGTSMESSVSPARGSTSTFEISPRQCQALEQHFEQYRYWTQRILNQKRSSSWRGVERSITRTLEQVQDLMHQFIVSTNTSQNQMLTKVEKFNASGAQVSLNLIASLESHLRQLDITLESIEVTIAHDLVQALGHMTSPLSIRRNPKPPQATDESPKPKTVPEVCYTPGSHPWSFVRYLRHRENERQEKVTLEVEKKKNKSSFWSRSSTSSSSSEDSQFFSSHLSLAPAAPPEMVINVSREMKKAYQRQVYPEHLLSQAIRLQYVVDTRLDEALEQAFVSTLTRSHDPNPFPNINAELSIAALRHDYWTDPKLHEHIPVSDARASSPLSNTIHLLEVPMMDTAIDDMQQTNADTEEEPQAKQAGGPQQTSFYGSHLALCHVHGPALQEWVLKIGQHFCDLVIPKQGMTAYSIIVRPAFRSQGIRQSRFYHNPKGNNSTTWEILSHVCLKGQNLKRAKNIYIDLVSQDIMSYITKVKDLPTGLGVIVRDIVTTGAQEEPLDFEERASTVIALPLLNQDPDFLKQAIRRSIQNNELVTLRLFVIDVKNDDVKLVHKSYCFFFQSTEKFDSSSYGPHGYLQAPYYAFTSVFRSEEDAQVLLQSCVPKEEEQDETSYQKALVDNMTTWMSCGDYYQVHRVLLTWLESTGRLTPILEAEFFREGKSHVEACAEAERMCRSIRLQIEHHVQHQVEAKFGPIHFLDIIKTELTEMVKLVEPCFDTRVNSHLVGTARACEQVWKTKILPILARDHERSWTTTTGLCLLDELERFHGFLKSLRLTLGYSMHHNCTHIRLELRRLGLE